MVCCARRHACVLVPALAAGLLMASCRQPPPSPDCVARCSLGEISADELGAFIKTLSEEQRRPQPGEDLALRRRRLLEDLLVERALVAEARSLGLDTCSEGAARVREVRNRMLVDLMRSELIRQRVRISDAVIATYYHDHPEEFQRQGQLRLRNIFLRVARDAPEEERQQVRAVAEELRQRLLAGADFGDLARSSSQSETAARGGLIGQVARGALDPSFEELVWSLGEGEVSEVVATAIGYQIFKVDNHLPPSRSDLDEVRGRIRNRLTAAATERLLQQVRDELLVESGARYRPQVLDHRTWSSSPSEILSFTDPEAAGLGLAIPEFRRTWLEKGFVKQREKSLAEQADDLVLDHLLLWKAAQLGLDERPELDLGVRRVLVEMAYHRRLEQWLEELDEAVLRRIYDESRERYRTPQLYHLHLLTRSFGERSLDQGWQPYTVYEELAQLAAGIRAGTHDFADAARQLSDDPSATDGGDLGLIRLDELLQWAGPPANQALAELPAGEVSEPILTLHADTVEAKLRRTGYMLVLISEVREPEPRSFEQVRVQVGNFLLDSTRGGVARGQIREEILDSLDPEIFMENL